MNSEGIRMNLSPLISNQTQSKVYASSDKLISADVQSTSDTVSRIGLQHPFAISLYRDRIYWTDWATNSVYSILKNGTGVPVRIKADSISPMDLQVYSEERQKPGN